MTLAPSGAAGVKLAVTVRLEAMVTAQLPAPVQSPLQPVKAQPLPAAGTSVTEVPLGWAFEQVARRAAGGRRGAGDAAEAGHGHRE